MDQLLTACVWLAELRRPPSPAHLQPRSPQAGFPHWLHHQLGRPLSNAKLQAQVQEQKPRSNEATLSKSSHPGKHA